MIPAPYSPRPAWSPQVWVTSSQPRTRDLDPALLSCKALFEATMLSQQMVRLMRPFLASTSDEGRFSELLRGVSQEEQSMMVDMATKSAAREVAKIDAHAATEEASARQGVSSRPPGLWSRAPAALGLKPGGFAELVDGLLASLEELRSSPHRKQVG